MIIKDKNRIAWTGEIKEAGQVQMAKEQYYGTGRRKSSVARVSSRTRATEKSL